MHYVTYRQKQKIKNIIKMSPFTKQTHRLENKFNKG